MSENPDIVGDMFSDHLVAFDERLAGNGTLPATRPSELPACQQADFEAATDCLRLLQRLRSQTSEPNRDSSGPDADDAELSALIDDWFSEGAIAPPSFGRFQLRRELGQGGFGVVFLAFDPILGREVALKLPRLDRLAVPEFRRRFIVEGRAAAGLEHRNIITVHEAGEIGEVCYLAMSYCNGPTLAEFLCRRTEPVPCLIAARVVAELADGVEQAHRRGILHRDLKPANVLLQDEGRKAAADTASLPRERAPTDDQSLSLAEFVPKISDFGIARIEGAVADATQSGTMLGTPTYMAPEQVDGSLHAIGPHTDVHALGAILYELLTLRPPFTALSPLEVTRQIVQEDAVSPRRIRGDLPEDLASICLKCLEKDPENRYPTAALLAEDLRHFLRDLPVLARSPSWAVRTLRWVRRNRAAAALISVVFFGALGTALAATWHSIHTAAKNAELEIAIQSADEQRQAAIAATRDSNLNGYVAHVRLASELLYNGQIRQMAQILNDARPQANASEFREFAWQYLRRLAGNEREVHGIYHAINDVVISADGHTLGSVSGDRTVRIWDVATGEARWSFTGFPVEPSTIALSNQGQYVAAAGGAGGTFEVHVWDNQLGVPAKSLHESGGLTGSITFLPNEPVVVIPCQLPGTGTGNDGGGVLLWNHVTDQRRTVCEGPYQKTAVAAAPNGQTIAAACQAEQEGEARLQLVATAGGEPDRWISCDMRRIDSLEFSPDGKLLAGGALGSVPKVWDALSGKEIAGIQLGAASVPTVGFCGDGRTLISVTERAPATPIFEMQSVDPCLPQVESRRADYKVCGLSCARDGHIVAAWGPGATIRLWRPSQEPAVVRLPGHSGETRGVAFLPDGRTLASAGAEGAIRLWSPTARREIGTLTGQSSPVNCVASSVGTNLLATGSDDHLVRLWNPADGWSSTTLAGHTDAVRTVALSRDGRLLASAGNDRRIRLWDVSAGRLNAVLEGCAGHVCDLKFSPDGKYLASVGTDMLARLWYLQNRGGAGHAVLRTLENDELWAVAFAPDNTTIVFGGKDGHMRFLETQTRAKRTAVGGHAAGIRSIAVSPDGQTVASGGNDQSVRLWHFATGHELICFRNLPAPVNCVAFSYDGTLLAAALHDGSLLLWSGQSDP